MTFCTYDNRNKSVIEDESGYNFALHLYWEWILAVNYYTIGGKAALFLLGRNALFIFLQSLKML